jgi:hypothetical protein
VASEPLVIPSKKRGQEHNLNVSLTYDDLPLEEGTMILITI